MATVEPIRKKEDIKKLEKILSKNKRNYLIFKIGINCGMRISDILSLDISDVKNKDAIIITEKKTQKKRIIPLNNKIKNDLKNFIQNKDDNRPLFVNNTTQERLSRISAYRIIKHACYEANIKGSFGTHTLRKTFGYHFYKKYNDIALLQKIFNHSHPAITLRYICIDDETIYNSYLNFIL